MEELRIFRRKFIPDRKIILNLIEVNHLKSLRIYNKDKILEVYNGTGDSYSYNIPSNEREGSIIPNSQKLHIPTPRIALGGAIPKGNRLDYLLHKATEIGVTEFHFCLLERSIRNEFSMERAERIFAEVCSQSERAFLPEVYQYKNWREIASNPGSELLVLHPGAREILKWNELPGRIVLVGPEGGFGSEIHEFETESVQVRNIGKGILRMETAYLYIASIMRQAQLNSQQLCE